MWRDGTGCLQTMNHRGERRRVKGSWFWLVLPAPEDPVEFATLMLGPSEETPSVVVRPVAERAEIVVGAMTFRLEAGASADRIASVARAVTAGA
jgi:transposase